LNLDHVIQERIKEHLDVVGFLKNDSKFAINLSEISNVITGCFKSGGKLLICGNGGSAADSQHLATELVSRFFLERQALDAEALTVNTSTLTAVANDYSFDKIYSRQVEAKGKDGDVLLAISTSGNSKNVIEAIKAAKNIGIKTIGFAGNNMDSLIYKMSDYYVSIPSNSTPRIQEAHILIGHIICEVVERNLFEKGG
jgi:D-sedoheptulose 7-phosphate isomerase